MLALILANIFHPKIHSMLAFSDSFKAARIDPLSKLSAVVPLKSYPIGIHKYSTHKYSSPKAENQNSHL